MNWQQVRARIQTCTRCPLAETRTRPVPWSGPVPAKIALVGEGPGQREDRLGRPFVGAAGSLLDQALADAGLDRGQVFVCNVVCCRPPGNRNPSQDEIDACWLDEQLAVSQAWIVVPAGAVALRAVCGMSGVMGKRGKPFWQDGRIVVPIVHPAWYARNRGRVGELVEDLRVVAALAEGYEPAEPPSQPRADTRPMRRQGWMLLHSRVLGDDIVLTDRVVTGRPPDWPSYSVSEVVGLAEAVKRGELSVEGLRALHVLKRHKAQTPSFQSMSL